MGTGETQLDFGPDVLLIFVGHSDDTREEIKAIRNIESKLQRELEGLLKVISDSPTFKVIRIWDWNYDAALGVGGQSTSITPYLRRANIALFVFKERIGTVTWDELLECKNRVEGRIPVIAVFPKTHPDSTRLSDDLQALDNWRELKQKKQELTKDWPALDSTSITPVEDYHDTHHLLDIIFNRLKSLLPNLLISKQEICPPGTLKEIKSQFLGEYKEFSFDRRPVIGYSIDQLDQRLVQEFLSKPLSQDEVRAAGVISPTTVEHLGILGLLQEGNLTLGVFLCFAPKILIANKFDACSLHLVSYDGITKAESKAQISKVRDNLLTLFKEGMGWLSSRSGLKRLGTVGTKDRDQLEIPEVALREALANALVHRNYENSEYRDQPTRIEVYEDRVEITSYGGLPNSVSIDQLNNDPENLIPVRRNPAIALIFNNMTHIELNASGVSRMRLETQKALLPAPKIYAEKDFVRVTFTRRSLGAIESLIKKDSPTTIRTPSRSVRSVFISSAARDLPEHRAEVMDACLRQGMFPVMMEHFPASDDDAISLSMEMVDQADVYLGVVGHRYGYIPKGHNSSITEMEYARAVERKIPRLVFVIGEHHTILLGDVDVGESAAKLKEFKERLQKENIVHFFNSPLDLRAHIINSLASFRERDLTTFHYVSEIPAPPEVLIAHPYTWLQTHHLVGRQSELNLLSDWVIKADSEVYKAHILIMVAIGGLGKSALTWKWFNDIAPQEMKPLAGRMWWSFHESDATFENFITRALAYVTRRTLDEVQRIPVPEREAQLLAALDREPFLIVLDGLERILIAYARMDAAHLADDDLDRQTANFVSNAYGLPPSAAQAFTGEHRLRKTADPRAGSFLRKLATVRAARIVISTRLYPADLQTTTGEPLPGCSAIFLRGLADEDALELWRAFGVSGARDSVLPLFSRVGNHPLLIQALAREVARYRRAPGDFKQWRRDHPDFDPFSLPLVQVKSHVLDFALRGLDDKARRALYAIAAFRMPAGYDTLAALLTGEDKVFADEHEMDEVLTELEDRGLVGWDKRANRYDLHPIVRGVVWSGLNDQTRRAVYMSLHAHFEALPLIDDSLEVNSLEDLTPIIELYNTLIGLERYDDAADLFIKLLDRATLYRLSASRQRIELLEMLFPEGLEQLPRLSKAEDQAFMLNALALGYQFSGQPGRAIPLFRRSNAVYSELKRKDNLGIGLRNLSDTLRASGALFASEAASRCALLITREQDNRFSEASCLLLLGLTLAARGNADESEAALQRSLRICKAQSESQLEGVVNSHLALRALWLGDFGMALSFANRAWELAYIRNHERDFIRAARRQGEAALGLSDYDTAEERLHHALSRARIVNHVGEELPALVALAELRRRQGDLKAAREFLDDIWDAAERGPYPLFHADAYNVLAQIQRDAGNTTAATEAATKAYALAWCDGPPFARHWGLVNAKKHLLELDAPPPPLPPFDEAKFEPMPIVEIDPEDEFHAGNNIET